MRANLPATASHHVSAAPARNAGGIQRWNGSLLPRLNLESILETQFPSPSTTRREEFATECGICYAYRLNSSDGKGETQSQGGSGAEPTSDGQGAAKRRRQESLGDTSNVPDTACSNPKCSRPFHRTCLFEWLRSDPTSRISFDTVFGTCPYCSSPISTRAT